MQVPENLVGTTLKTQDALFKLTLPEFTATTRLTFSQEVRVVQTRGSDTPPTPQEYKPIARTLYQGVISPGGILTYTFRLTNEGTTTIPEVIDIEAPVPANTTYKSGGTYKADQKMVTFDNISSLPPGESRIFTLVVEVPQATAIGSTIDAPTLQAWYPLGGGSFRSIITFTPGKTSVMAAGTILTVYKNAQGVAFDPEIHGYGFQNYGKHAGAADDLGPADVFDLFGPKTCKNKNATRNNCQLSAAGTQWIKSQLDGMNGGHCEGMAVTAQRFFETLPFKAMTSPNEFQPGKNTVYSLAFPGQTVENYVASYFVRQTFDEVSSEASQSRDTMTPAQIVDKLIEEFNKTPSIGYAVGFFKPGYKEGHAVTPYAIERIGNTDEYRIVVYDNNFPGQKRYITVNKTTNKWSYMAAADPTQKASLYEGDASTKTLGINRISLRDMPTGQYFTCDFCGNDQISAASTTTETLEISFSGEGKILVVDDEGRRTGYDFATEKEVNEINNVVSTPVKHGLGLDLPPVYTVPYLTSDGLYQVYVGGSTAESLTDGDLTITGDDFVMGVDYIVLGANEIYRFDISPDGDEIFFEASQDTIAPALYMAFDPASQDDPGLVVEIDGMLLKQGEVVYIGVDKAKERVYLVSTAETVPAMDREFYLDVTAIWADGEELTKNYEITLPKGTHSAYLDYSDWNPDGEAKIVVERALYLPSLQR